MDGGVRRALLDPQEPGTGWVLVAAAPTGVVYEVQGGGEAWVPLLTPDGPAASGRKGPAAGPARPS
ncbi:hypothetical protein [Streptomyces sp. NPDC002962]|uniref:hypothetical protein n=1 Tax=Streptomyces sp. NPDC002962 TaxID=3364674 RepID=UPI0036BD38FF